MSENPVKPPRPIRQYLLIVGIAIGGALIGRLLPGFQMPPLPLETIKQIEETNAAVKKLESNQAAILRINGLRPE